MNADTGNTTRGATKQCDRCGAASAFEYGYVNNKTTKGKTLCLTCYLYEHQQNNKHSLHFFAAFALVAMLPILLTWEDSWALLNIVLFVASLYVTIVPHELGHALGAQLARMEVLQITMGAGPRLLAVRLGKRYLELRMYPVEGMVICIDKNLRFVRLKRFIMVLFGPLANLAIAALLVLLFHERITGVDFFNEPAPLLTFFLANIVMGAVNLVPFTTATAVGSAPSDGKQLLSLPFSPKKKFENYLSNNYVASAALALLHNDYAAGEKICAEGLARFPNNHHLVSIKTNLLILSKDYHTAKRLLADTIASGELAYPEKALAENNIAWIDYLLNDPGLLDEADRLSRAAMEVLPWSLAVRSTRGAILIEQNEIEAGIEMLNDKRLEIETKTNRALALCSLAMGYLKSGRMNEAKSALSKARALDPGCALLARAEAAVSKTLNSPSEAIA